MEAASTSHKKLPKKNELTKKRASRWKKHSLSLVEIQREEEEEEEEAKGRSDAETVTAAEGDSDDGESGQQEASGVSSIIAEMKEKDEEEADENAKAGFTEEDVKTMEELSRMPLASMAAHIQAMDSQLYELSQLETRELSRSKHLRVFSNYRRRSK
ncbi:GL16735 [Drosophila persimilis]|uniref:GL16735 n=1 Tax=Drosophila persimilis TaxID=7234 RepID=B4GIK4_DROPE|nr:uncharacterized protein LOC6592215 [Drosophila persimilis]EDW36324.1 GL16735 [Drosophila persimilis]